MTIQRLARDRRGTTVTSHQLGERNPVMHYLIDGQPFYRPQCGKPIAPWLRGWEAQDRFHNSDHPFSCDCNARYLIASRE